MNLAEPIPHRATCVAIDGQALLIEGEPGTGKSSLALALMDRGAELIGDDGVLLEAAGDGLIARPHPQTRGLMEIRGLGLLPFPARNAAQVALVLQLDEDAPRFIEAPEQVQRAGRVLPLIRLWPHSPVLALRAEYALAAFGLIGD